MLVVGYSFGAEDPPAARYDVQSNVWQEVQGAPVGEHWLGPTAMVRRHDGRVLTLFGTHSSLYDPQTGQFSAGPVTVDPFRDLSSRAALLADGRVLLTGGTEATSLPALQSAEILDPDATTLCPQATPSRWAQPRWLHPQPSQAPPGFRACREAIRAHRLNAQITNPTAHRSPTMISSELAALLAPFVERAVADGLPRALTDKVIWVVERSANRKRPFRTVYPSDQSFLEAVRQEQPKALELAVAFAPAFSPEAAELPYQVLAKAESRPMQDAALEGIASIGDERAFRALLEHDSARAQTLYGGRVFERALPIVEERLDRALVAVADATTPMEPRKRVRIQALVMHLARHPKTRCRKLVFDLFAEHAERELQYVAGAVLWWWGDDESLDALEAHIDDADAHLQGLAVDSLFRRNPRAVYDHFGGDALRTSKDHVLVDRLLTRVGRDCDRNRRGEPLGVLEADERWLELAAWREKDRRRTMKEAALYVLESAPAELVEAARNVVAAKKRRRKRT